MFLFLALLFRTQVKSIEEKKKTSMERLKWAGSPVDHMQLNGCLPLFHRPSRTVPWVTEVLLSCGRNFRYWPKAETALEKSLVQSWAREKRPGDEVEPPGADAQAQGPLSVWPKLESLASPGRILGQYLGTRQAAAEGLKP